MKGGNGKPRNEPRHQIKHQDINHPGENSQSQKINWQSHQFDNRTNNKIDHTQSDRRQNQDLQIFGVGKPGQNFGRHQDNGKVEKQFPD